MSSSPVKMATPSKYGTPITPAEVGTPMSAEPAPLPTSPPERQVYRVLHTPVAGQNGATLVIN